LRPEHLPVFACSMGDNTIHYLGHVKMMGAVQPFISGAISKTVNMPEDATIEDVESLHLDAWRLGIKAVAIYRDNCKVGQPLSTATKGGVGQSAPDAVVDVDAAEVIELYARVAKLEAALEVARDEGAHVVVGAVRERLPRRRKSATSALWRTARGTSRSVSTRTVDRARSSSRSPNKVRPWRASWTPSQSRSAWDSSTGCRSRRT